MPPRTRTELTAELQHVLHTMLDLPDDLDLERCLHQNGYNSISMILGTDETTLRSLQYTPIDDDGNELAPTTLIQGMLAYLRLLRRYKYHRFLFEDDFEDWNGITREEITDFLAQHFGTTPDPQHMVQNSAPHANTGMARSRGRNQTTSETTPVDKFEKGIRRDPTPYPKLTDMKYWDSFATSFQIHANAQGLSNVLDSTYVPPNNQEEDLFK